MTSLNPVFSIGNQVNEAIKIHQDIPQAQRPGADPGRPSQGQHPRRRVPRQGLPHQLSGDAPARRRRHRHLLRAGRPHRRRADHLPGRYHPGPVPQAAQDLQQQQDWPSSSSPRLRRRRQDVRPGGRDVRCKIVETGDVREIFNSPSHPIPRPCWPPSPSWKRTLIASTPLKSAPGSPRPAPRLRLRRPLPLTWMDQCRDEYPPVFRVSESHQSACWRLA